MRKLVLLAAVLAFGFAAAFTDAAMAQKKHASKGIWKGMSANIGDIQGISAALMVFDMERAAKIADELVAREVFISNIARFPEVVRKGHGKVADAAKKLAAAVKAGEDQEASVQIGAVLAACSSCHYDVRDAKRRKEMQ